MSDEQAPLRLVLTLDRDLPDWMHIQNAQMVVVTLQDLPRPLQFRIRPIALALMQRHVNRCDIDERLEQPFLTDGHPFDERLLGIRELIEQFRLLQWWIDYQHRRSLAQPDAFGHQPHKTWKCECGEDVKPAKELCDNRTCASWEMWVQCTGGKLRAVAKHTEEKTVDISKQSC